MGDWKGCRRIEFLAKLQEVYRVDGCMEVLHGSWDSNDLLKWHLLMMPLQVPHCENGYFWLAVKEWPSEQETLSEKIKFHPLLNYKEWKLQDALMMKGKKSFSIKFNAAGLKVQTFYPRYAGVSFTGTWSIQPLRWWLMVWSHDGASWVCQ